MTATTFATDNATLVRSAIEQGGGAMFAPGYVFHAPPEVYEADCPSTRISEAVPYAGPFGNPQIRFEDVSAHDDRVVVRFAGHGSHNTEFRGVAPSGRERTASVLAVYRIERGRIAEGWDTLSWD